MQIIIYNELVSRDYEVFVGKTYKGEIDFVVMIGKKISHINIVDFLLGKKDINLT